MKIKRVIGIAAAVVAAITGIGVFLRRAPNDRDSGAVNGVHRVTALICKSLQFVVWQNSPLRRGGRWSLYYFPPKEGK
jgi:hypothetical protein